jgi:predicted transcriptional regulator
LYTAAAVLAREKAGIPISKISEELGVTEATIRIYLKGETRARELVLKAYERLAKEGFKINLPEIIESDINKKLRKVKELLEAAIKELSS